MLTIKDPQKMQNIILNLKKQGKTIGFVPTMGALHEAHLTLIRKSKRQNDATVVSIFVNPKQFGPKEDYLRYPRPFEIDKKKLIGEKVDYLFAPDVKDMYPEDYLTYVNVERMSDILCGKFRPGHFKGVTTVVAKLFNIIPADRAYFGEKDYQQLKIIQKMVRDLNFPIKIIPCKTVREKDGLAMSSRNVYLNEVERKNATKIYEALKFGKKLIKSGEKSVKKVKREIMKVIKKIKNAKIEYVEVVEPETLKELKKIKLPLRILTAVWVGKARLIDNVEVR